jgi:membrane protease YdiL (CAAX protease family)
VSRRHGRRPGARAVPASRRSDLPPVLSGWPAWVAPAALAGAWAAGVFASILVAIAFGGAHPAAARLALAIVSGALTVALLAWLAGRGGHERGARPQPAGFDGARRVAVTHGFDGSGRAAVAPGFDGAGRAAVTPGFDRAGGAAAVAARLGVRRCDPRRALVAGGLAAAALALSCGLLALAGAVGGVRVPRELTRLDGLAWAAGWSEPAVPFDVAAVASLLARAVVGTVVLELLLRGAVLPALARAIGAWPAIAVTALVGGISFGALAGDGRLLVPAVALGALLGPLLVATGSIVPGAALSSGFAAAAMALACGWGPAGAAIAAAGCAAAASAVLLAATGPSRQRAADRLPSPRAGALAAERGQSAAEYMGVLLLVALIVGAIAVSGAGALVAAHMEQLICRIAGEDCSRQAALDKDCLLASSTGKGGVAVTVAIVKVGTENTLIKQVYADGRTVFTLLKHGTVAAELIAGAKARAGKVGFDATASVSAGGKLEGAMTYTFTDPAEAAEFERMVREHGSFEQVARDAVEGFDPFGVKDWVLDHTVGEDVDPGDLPEPDSRYVNVDVLVTGDAKAIGNVIVADAGARALLGLAGGARIYTSGPDAGRVDLNIRLVAELAASLGLVTFGPNVTGKGQFTATVTLDKDHGYRPSHLRVIGTAGYNGDLGGSDLLLAPTSGQLEEIQDALERGKLESAALGSTDGSGHQVEFTGDLDLTTAADRAAALRALTGDGSGAAELVRRLDADGRLTFQAYDTTSSSTEAGLKVGLGPGLGAEGGQSHDSRELGASWVREPGARWLVRNCGLTD